MGSCSGAFRVLKLNRTRFVTAAAGGYHRERVGVAADPLEVERVVITGKGTFRTQRHKVALTDPQRTVAELLGARGETPY